MKRSRTWRKPAFVLAIIMLCAAVSMSACTAQNAKFEYIPAANTVKSPWLGTPPAELSKDFKFAVISDNTGLAEPGRLEEGLALINGLDVDFVTSVGDLIEGYSNDDAALQAMYDLTFDKLSVLEKPFFITPGNHDLGSEQMKVFYRKTIGDTYYAYRYGDALFIVMDSEDPTAGFTDEFAAQIAEQVAIAQVDYPAVEAAISAYYDEWQRSRLAESTAPESGLFSAEQTDFVIKTLEENKDVKWTFLFLHRPGWEDPESGFAPVEEALAGRNYTVFSGHYHYLKKTTRNNMLHVQLGRTGGGRHAAGPGAVNHITLVEFKDGTPNITFHLYGKDSGVKTVDDIEVLDSY